jgi:pilus assembly protein Flp/PilA
MGTKVRRAVWRLGAALRGDEGATAVEYALMVALIALVIVAAVTLVGQETNDLYNDPGLQGALGG